MHTDPITESFELAASRCGDLTPLVYARLYREFPQVETLFRKDAHLVQGEMLSRTIEAILDFATDRSYAQHLFAAEATTHAGYEVPPDTFVKFFRIIAATLRDLLGEQWTPRIDAAWRAMLTDIETCALAPNEASPA